MPAWPNAPCRRRRCQFVRNRLHLAGIHPRLVELIRQHRSTMLFVNSRRLAERLAQALNEVAEADIARAHHGSLAKDSRLEIENQLKQGRLPPLSPLRLWNWALIWGRGLGDPDRESPLHCGRNPKDWSCGTSSRRCLAGMIFPKYRGDLLACSAARHACWRRC